MEHIEAFGWHSQWKVWCVNTANGFPRGLNHLHFRIIVLHYSLFGSSQYYLDERFRAYLDRCDSGYKIGFFQDEYRYCQQRFSFLNRYKIDCIYTLLEPQYFQDTYWKYTQVPKLISCLPGYVSASLIEAASRLTVPDRQRRIDVGYRGRPLAYYMGKGAREKTFIAREFLKRAHGLNLTLDITWEEPKRIYGEKWYRFLANCRGVLGVESGVSIFDVEDTVRMECEKLLASNPGILFHEVYDRLLYPYEDNIPYRTISPRHFEAAAFRVCQILFEGKYSGILKPMVHYIALKKDFSNFEEVIRLFSDPDVRHELTENAYRDLIASGQYSYKRFIESFDVELINAGLRPQAVDDEEAVTALLEAGSLGRRLRSAVLGLRFYSDLLPDFLKTRLRPFVKPFSQGNWRE